MSAIGMPRNGRSFVMSAEGYRHDRLFFERQQSLSLRGMEWEGRVQPLTPWSTIMLRAAGAVALFGAIVAIAV